MKNRFSDIIHCSLLVASVSGMLFCSCSDDYDLDDKDNCPGWLGNSIYEALENPQSTELSGTFNHYLKLVDDLGYTDILGKTGSKTVFPANDAAFEKFFMNNSWGVSKYSDLSDAQKRLLLYNSMIDNAIPIQRLSNVATSTTDPSQDISRGMLMQHNTAANVIDTITHIYGPSGMPANNQYWTKYYSKGIDIVMDATRSRMVHFTPEFLLNNSITTDGDESDFKVITGTDYTEGSAFVFRDKVLTPNLVCKNGYIHQMESIVVPLGNMAQAINSNDDCKLYARMLDRFSAPYYDAVTTKNYNDWALANKKPLIDSIFQKRYFSKLSEGGSLITDPNNVAVSSVLVFDPGWNAYKKSSTATDFGDVGVMFVPTDAAMEKYLLPGGEGSFLIDRYGASSNTEDNLPTNIDCIPQNIVATLINNLMNNSFVSTVPSKFNNILDMAGDPMGISLSSINTKNGKYDIEIANNGVIYMLNTVFAPPQYIAVSAPALFSSNMKFINWAIQNGSSDKSILGLNYYGYLLAMKANYALFLPSDDAFANGVMYVDPAYLGHDEPRVLKFYYDDTKKEPACISYKYDKINKTVGDKIEDVKIENVITQINDILFYNTVVLSKGEALGANNYYKTKQGGEILFESTTVNSGAQIDNGLPVANITTSYKQSNGRAYAIDHLIQGPEESVYHVLNSDSRFSEFMDLCNYSNQSEVLTFAGISNEQDPTFGTSPQDKYMIFKKAGLDYDVKVFNSFNYTVYAPDNTAMEKAYAAGLPKWSEAYQIAQKSDPTDEDKALVKKMVDEIHRFIMYHFQDNSVYADNVISGGVYQTSCVDDNNLYQKVMLSGENGKLYVTDNSGQKISINVADNDRLKNVMTRDFVFDKNANEATKISASSFAVIHEISQPLCWHSTFGYNVK